MKSLTRLMFVCAAVLMVQVAFTQILGSAHDFSDDGFTQNTFNEICNVCHTPHNGTAIADAPLWDHDLTAKDYTGQLYVGSDMQGAPGLPDGSSLLCLSCHDGTIAVDSYGGTTGSVLITDAIYNGPGENRDIGGDGLANDHPISLVYDNALFLADGELFDPDNDPSGLGGSIAADLLDLSSKVQCSSCHDVHNGSGAPAGQPLLVKDNTNSNLCRTCHDK